MWRMLHDGIKTTKELFLLINWQIKCKCEPPLLILKKVIVVTMIKFLLGEYQTLIDLEEKHFFFLFKNYNEGLERKTKIKEKQIN